MALIDEVVIRVISGAGGDGCRSFRREKYVPFGGPDGGNGGRGGDVYLLATRDKTSLLDFKYRPKYQADRGDHGKGKQMDGRGGADLEIAVPVGTLVYSAESGELLCDLVEHGQKYFAAEGGKGGRGNLTFVSSTNRAPRTTTPGELGKVADIKLELRLIADVGLIGLPNAGKSSFLRVISRAMPKVADYPFTTLEPHLGVANHKDQGFVVADLPGLIEGAADGAGLGFQFLRHVSRNRVLLHLVELNEDIDEMKKSIALIRSELEQYDPQLLDREQLLVFTKADLIPEGSIAARQVELEEAGLEGFIISSHSGYGVSELLDELAERVHRAQPSQIPAELEVCPAP